MIRLVLVLLLLVIVWLLFIANFTRNQRIIGVIVTCMLFVGAVWFDDNRKRPKSNILALDDISSCGIEAASPYRSNYDFSLCFENIAKQGTVRRLSFEVVASDCNSQPCQTVETVLREMPLTIAAGERALVKQNLKFDTVAGLLQNTDEDPAMRYKDIRWSVNLVEVKATPN